MAYGEKMFRLNPCGDAFICDLTENYCPHLSCALDVGCGRGERLAALSRRFPGATLVGVDADVGMVRTAQKKCSAEIICVDACCLPFPKESFDLLLCECSLSLFSDPKLCLEEMYRVLRRDGQLILSDLFSGDGHNYTDLAERDAIKNVFSSEAIGELLCSAGFVVKGYFDRSDDLITMAAQMLFDGNLTECLGDEAVGLLMRARAGYGLWICERKA